MITRVTTVNELKQVFVETLLNNTNKVTKVSDGSVLNGVAYGVSKLAQKVLKDVAVVEAHLFPDSASGQYLDNIASLRGVAPRFGAIPSTTFVRVVGSPGTTYTPLLNTFSGQGFDFRIQEQVIIGVDGYAYVKVVCETNGEQTNIDPLTINSISPIPAGHEYCINEYSATGGRDFEDDDLFRKRIKEEINVLARGTISYIEQVMRKYNNNVLRVFNYGLDSVGELVLGIATVNGQDLSIAQLSDLKNNCEQWLNINELKPNGLSGYGVKFENCAYFPIDVSCRVDIEPHLDSDQVRKNIQLNMSKVVDYRFWTNGGEVYWLDIINAIKNTNGVVRVLDNHFYPNTDFKIPRGHLPRFRGFLMMNLAGQILENSNGNLDPFYYPTESDFVFQASVLKSLT